MEIRCGHLSRTVGLEIADTWLALVYFSYLIKDCSCFTLLSAKYLLCGDFTIADFFP